MLEDRGVCTIHKPDVAGKQPPKQFTFDGAYYTESTTEQIYNDIAYPLVEVSDFNDDCAFFHLTKVRWKVKYPVKLTQQIKTSISDMMIKDRAALYFCTRINTDLSARCLQRLVLVGSK